MIKNVGSKSFRLMNSAVGHLKRNKYHQHVIASVQLSYWGNTIRSYTVRMANIDISIQCKVHWSKSYAQSPTSALLIAWVGLLVSSTTSSTAKSHVRIHLMGLKRTKSNVECSERSNQHKQSYVPEAQNIHFRPHINNSPVELSKLWYTGGSM